MTPKEKAEELVGKYYFQVQTLEQQKQCALIAVDEMIDFIDPEAYGLEMDLAFGQIRYLQEVKKEIEKL